MSAEQNMHVFRQMIDELWTAGRLESAYKYFSPVYIEHQFGFNSTIEDVQKNVLLLHTSFPDFTLTVEEMVADGDKVWARLKGSGTNTGGFFGPPNGKPFVITVFDVARFENGKMVEHWGVPDRFAVLAQLGLLPGQAERSARREQAAA